MNSKKRTIGEVEIIHRDVLNVGLWRCLCMNTHKKRLTLKELDPDAYNEHVIDFYRENLNLAYAKLQAEEEKRAVRVRMFRFNHTNLVVS